MQTVRVPGRPCKFGERTACGAGANVGYGGRGAALIQKELRRWRGCVHRNDDTIA
jgi:hypothetical protein